MTVLRVNTIAGIGSDGAGTVLGGSFNFTSQNYVILPKGTTDNRVGLGSTPGALRYNTDSSKVELYDGSQWTEVQSSIPLTGGARGVFGGGYSPGVNLNVIEYITISSTGNSIDFGDLTQSRSNLRAVSSTTRGVFTGGGPGATPAVNTIDYITISSTGNAQDFGDLLQGRGGRPSSCSDSTRGIIMGGYGPAPTATDINSIDYITIASTGNAQDFGDMLAAAFGSLQAGCSSSTRGISAGSYAPGNTNTIQYLTIASTGNAQDFGDLTQVKRNADAASSPTRGVIMGGVAFPAFAWTNVIEFITIATLGNGTDFGDLTQTKLNGSACSSHTRCIYAGGTGPSASPAQLNVIEYFEISTSGNAIDFGDLQALQESPAALSNAHGGL